MSREFFAVLSGIGIIIVIGLLITRSSGSTAVLGSLFSGGNEIIRTLQFQQSNTGAGH